jgi:hypothetical protein
MKYAHVAGGKRVKQIEWTRFPFKYCLELYKELRRFSANPESLPDPDLIRLPDKATNLNKRRRETESADSSSSSNEAITDEGSN